MPVAVLEMQLLTHNTEVSCLLVIQLAYLLVNLFTYSDEWLSYNNTVLIYAAAREG